MSAQSRANSLWCRARSRFGMWVVFLSLAVAAGGCVYFNTFYHARQFYKEGERMRKQAGKVRSGITPGKNSYENAIEKAAKIVEKHPKSKYHDDALFMIGMCYFRIGNYTKSENAFRELLATHPQSNLTEETRLYLARCRIELGDDRAGFREFTALAETARKREWRAEAIYQRGVFFNDNGIYDSAVVEFSRVLEEYPKSERAVDCRLLAGGAMRQLGRYDEAIDLYQPLAEDDEEENIDLQFAALNGIGVTCYESGRTDSGIAVFAAMVDDERFEDSIGSIRLALARGLRDIGEDDEAWRQYERVVAALERTPSSAEAYFRMAEIRQFVDEDLVTAKELYDQSRLENAAGGLAQEALARSAHITKLEQFRIDLGRGELTRRGSALVDEGPYDRARMPRLEREITFSPLAARPREYGLVELPDDSTLALLGPPTPTESAVSGEVPVQAGTMPAPSERYGPPTGSAPYLGPPVNAADIAYNEKRRVLLDESEWLMLIDADSALGPPSPAYLYEFGDKGLLGPVTPPDSVLHMWAFAGVDTVAERLRAEREAARAARQAEVDAIRASATTQLQLAELYRFSLANPESALVEYDNMVERYPNSPFAPKALLGAADVLTNDLSDTAEAEVRLRRILSRYPYSDYAGEAITRLGLQGSAVDTAYPALVYRQIEDTYLAGGDPQRALEELEAFIAEYPDSRLVPSAEFAIVTLKEVHFPAEDSSIVLAYREIESSYPQTIFAEAASEKLTFSLVRPQRRQRAVAPPEDQLAQAGVDSTAGDSAEVGPKLPRAPRADSTFEQYFVYPESEFGVYDRALTASYKIWIDIAGDVTEVHELMGTGSFDIDENARLAVQAMKFNPDSIPFDSLNMYYRFDVTITPEGREIDDFEKLGVPKISEPDKW